MKKFSFCVFAAFALTFCAVADDWRDFMWEKPVALRDGVTLRAYALEKPRKMKAYVVRIDLTTPGISFTASERASNWGDIMPDYPEKPMRIDTKREATADFMMRRRGAGKNVEIAVNTSGWGPWVRPFTHEFASLRNWVVADGVEVSHGKDPSKGVYFFIRNDGSARICRGISPAETNDVVFSAYGMGLIMTNGVSAIPGDQPKYTNKEPRTAIGLTPDGKTLVLLSVDGRQPGYSLGASYADLAEIMRREGVADAINMDGGGSSSLVVFDHKNDKPLMLNHHKDGVVRKVATSLGIVFADGGTAPRRLALDRTGAQYHSYEFLPIEDTPPPEGFKPFYISHYGRHGSRRISGSTVAEVLGVLEKAAAQGGLTDEGCELLAAMRRLSEAHDGMIGELSERGAEEHRRLARRMAERFPDVFGEGRRVRCRATLYPRVHVSMENFVMSLRDCTPRMGFDFTSGDRYFHLLCEPYFAKRSEGLLPKLKSAVLAVAGREMKPAGLIRRIFADPKFVEDKIRFMHKLFTCASGCQCVRAETDGLDLYRFFTPDEIAAGARVIEAEAYVNMGNCAEFGDLYQRVSAPLVRDFLSRGDAAIADDRVAVDLRFGHDNGVWPLAILMGLEGPDARVPIGDAWKDCPASRWSPMAANLQMVLYRNAKGEVLVKFLYNEREMRLRGLDTATGPYYTWSAARDFISHRCPCR